ncbi:MAG TPA: outer membrane protein transport protein [Thermoanaerobaculia bacterium]|nr:outer membrane protein transport protein [Thermoanaerobaculia bacterium]
MLTTSAFGSGFALFEHGAKAVAMGGAFAATADDPSAIFYNVAGIAQLRKTEVLFGDTLINFQNSYKGDPNDIFTAGTSGSLYRAHTFSVPNAYVTVPFGSNLTFGVGVFAPFGLRTNWAQPWIGRYVSNDADIKTVSVEPAVAWQTSDGRLAVGVGAEYRRARVILDQTAGPAFNPFTGRFADLADSYLSSDWSSKWGWNVGVLFKPTPMWRLGASYRAPMTIGFTGTATITQIPSGNAQFDALVKAQLPPTQPVNTSIPFPSFLYLAAGTSVIHNWDIEFDAVRNDWNRFKTLQINLETTPQASVTRTENWKSTWSYRLGTNHPVATHWDIRLGALYDKNPEPVTAVTPLLPDADREGVSFGLGYHNGPFIIDATEFALHFKRRGTNGTAIFPENINGTYQTDANLVTINFGYRF